MGSGSSRDPAAKDGQIGQARKANNNAGFERKRINAAGSNAKTIITPTASAGQVKQQHFPNAVKEVTRAQGKQLVRKVEIKNEKETEFLKESVKIKGRQENSQEEHDEQVAAQKNKAFDERQRKAKILDDQEELSIEQQAIQQYKAFAASQAPAITRQDSKQRALMEADALLNAYAPPPTKPKSASPIIFYPDSGMQADRDAISCIVPGELYLTNFRGVGRKEELKSLGVKHIVCVNEQDNEFVESFNYFNIDTLEDQEDHDAMQHFTSVAQFTRSALASGGAVCFHCAAGISRSSTMIISYLMTSKKMSLLEAFERTYNARRVTWPNRTFMKQLIEYEHELQLRGDLPGKKPSLTLEQWDAWTAGDEEQVFVLPCYLFGL
jgi:predicted protein tyrosine phosphatase